MTPRERLDAVMHRKPVDRVPRDLCGTGQTQVDAPEVTEALKRLLNINGAYTGEYKRYDERILDTLCVDTRRVGFMAHPESPLTCMRGAVKYDCWGVGRAFSGLYWDIVDMPIEKCLGRGSPQLPLAGRRTYRPRTFAR